MRNIECTICTNHSETKTLYKERIKREKINEDTYSARRSPDVNHYQIVQCKKCGLVFSTPIMESREIEELYKGSKFTYKPLVKDLQGTYGHCLKRIEELVPSKERLLEIGCGNGFLLEKAREMGYQKVYGVEPSIEAVRQAPSLIAPSILNCTFGPNLYPESFFDVVCSFQTLDHIISPTGFLYNCRSYLKRRGVVLCVTHNIESWATKLLGEKCPMFDIEHIYLFSPYTLRKLFQKSGFYVVEVFDVANTFPLWYYAHLLPLFKHLKLPRNIGDIKLTTKMGNIGIVAVKIK